MSKTKLWLGFIIFLAAFLRFYQLGLNPPSLTWDEVAWGYNAYSLGLDGRDEFGKFLPYDYLESFGDYKPPLYAYLSVIPVKLFGLNEFSTRFASALFGTLTVLITYFLVKQIFEQRVEEKDSSFSKSGLIALFGALFLAVSPWHINLSRAAFEANVASFFIVTGVFLFLLGLKKKKWLLVFSVVSFVLSLHTFNTARVVSPILFLLLSFAFWKDLWKVKFYYIVALIVGLILIFPSVRFFLSPQATLRFKEVNIFSETDVKPVVLRINQSIENDHNAWWSKVIHNRRFEYSVEFLKHYSDHLKPNFLFVFGDGNPKFSTQDVGEMYLWDLPFFITGLLIIFRQRWGKWWLLPVWLLLGIMPAATARETPHALRIETTLPTFQIIAAYGFVIFLLWTYRSKRKLLQVKIQNLLVPIVFLLFFINVAYYLHGYYVHYPREYSGEWQYGYKESIQFSKDNERNYDEIWVTTELGRPYEYYLFYLKTDPQVFRKEAIVEREVFGFTKINQLGKYHFAKDFTRDSKKKNKRVLYIDIPIKIPNDAIVVKMFYLLNGNTSLVAYRDKM